MPWIPMRSRRVSPASLALALTFAGLVGCRGVEQSGSATGGTLIIANPADPDILFPPLMQNLQSKQVVDLLFDHLAEVGDDLNIVGDRGFSARLAQKWSWAPDSMSIAFQLDPRARWHDGQPVRASDVRFSFAVCTDSIVASPMRQLLSNVDSVSTPDS